MVEDRYERTVDQDVIEVTWIGWERPASLVLGLSNFQVCEPIVVRVCLDGPKYIVSVGIGEGVVPVSQYHYRTVRR